MSQTVLLLLHLVLPAAIMAVMEDLGYLLSIYLHLARASGQRRRPFVRDRLLILAGVCAEYLRLPTVADYCRRLVLQHNPQHMINRWPTLRDALTAYEFRCFFRQLRRRFPQERAERLLQSLGIELGNERDAYYSDYEYAASLLGTTPDDLDREFGGDSPA